MNILQDALSVMLSGESGSNLQHAPEFTSNGTKNPDDGYDGFDYVVVNVSGSGATIEQLNVTANGTYAATASVDGYAPVIVNVPTNDALTGLITFFGMFKNEQYIGTPTI